MTVVMFGNFGRDEKGIYTYSVNTTSKDDIQLIIDGIIAGGGEFVEQPEIGFKRRTFHCLLKFHVPKNRKDEPVAIVI